MVIKPGMFITYKEIEIGHQYWIDEVSDGSFLILAVDEKYIWFFDFDSDLTDEYIRYTDSDSRIVIIDD